MTWVKETLAPLERASDSFNAARLISRSRAATVRTLVAVGTERSQSLQNFVVPVRINDKITLDFTLDSGASDVTIPADVFSTLRRTHTISDSDLIGTMNYQLVDGSTRQAMRFIGSTRWMWSRIG